MMIGTSACCLRARTIESPSSSGMLRSSTIRSGACLRDGLAQARAAVAQRHLEAVQPQIVADHLARRRFVVDDEDVLAAGHHQASVAPAVGS